MEEQVDDFNSLVNLCILPANKQVRTAVEALHELDFSKPAQMYSRTYDISSTKIYVTLLVRSNSYRNVFTTSF